MNSNTRLLAVLNLIGYIGVLVVNGLANALPINGMNTGEISDLYPNLFVPAGLTFSIWGIIYLQLGIFVALGLIRAFGKNANDSFVSIVGPWFLVTCVLNMSWIFAWQYLQVVPSILIMLTFLATLIFLVQKLSAPENRNKIPVWTVKAAFSVYLGWISLATIANLTAVLVYFNWSGFGIGEVLWTQIMMVVAIVLAFIFMVRKRDGFYGLPIAWALLGIYLKRASATPLYPEIFWIGLVGSVLVAGFAVYQLITKRLAV